MSKNGFNDEQYEALLNPIDVDLQVTAGAGSGKTKTLSEKVMRLIEDGLKPSELLVLTFTNNAAHEMKERIIAKFHDRKDIAFELASAHIQTFDSFSQYLVSMYSHRLKIAEKISVVNKDVIDTKKKELVDQLFEEYYNDNEKKEAFLRTLIKFNLRDDEVSKMVVLDLVDNIEKLPPKERNAFLNNYSGTFLSRSTFDKNIDELINRAKKIIEDEIFYAYFYEKNFDALENSDFLTLNKIFKDRNNFNIDIYHLRFDDVEFADPLYRAYISLLGLKGIDFINGVKEFYEKNQLYLKQYKSQDLEKKKLVAAQSVLRGLINNNKSYKLDFIAKLHDLDEEYQKVLYFKKDIEFYLEMVKIVLKRLDEFKKITNTYTFSDLSLMALSLMIDEQYKDVAEEIRSRFKFIMVDEYQDTNDLQELFIDSLLKENKKGERSHLFCVGDAKQSIYAFRDSNVQLFKDRQYRYESLPDDVAKVIPMNKNYRSGKGLLHDINHIFNYYMTINHGGIAYHQDSESLQYDDAINLYSQPYEHFGVHRIISTSSINNDNVEYGAKEWEARAIAQDIRNKINNKFKVSVRTSKGNVLRECSFGDFCVLVGVKASVDIYQKIFQEYEIPLNCKVEKDLNELDVVTAIKSLISMMEYIVNDKQSDPMFAHLFTSVARSYLFEYDDQTLFDLLNDPSHQYFELSNDPIVIQITEFINKYKGSSLSALFIELLTEFKVIEKLNKLGDVDDSISKIESLYQMAVSAEQAGEGLTEFVELLNNIKKYDTKLSSESLYQVEDAVDLMTIHGSKGLERKIVYLPCSFNYITKGEVGAKPDYIFSRKLGILLPYYNYQYSEKEEDKTFSTLSINHLMHTQLDEDNKIKRDEHVRLFYVALTRAENAVYIVGDLPKLSEGAIKKQRNDDKPYGMLSYMPYYILLNDKFIKDKIKNNIVEQDDYDIYLKHIAYIKMINRDITNDDLNIEQYERYSSLWKDKYLTLISNKITSFAEVIEKQLFVDYLNKFNSINDYDDLFSVFALYFTKDESITGIKDIDKLKRNYQGDDDDDSGDDNLIELVDIINKDNYKEILDLFKYSINNIENLNLLHLSFNKEMLKKAKKEMVPYIMMDAFLPVFALHYDKQRRIKHLSFECDDYKDKTIVFDYKQYPPVERSYMPPKLPSLKVDNTPIEFKERIKLRASKHTIDEELPAQEILDRGIKLHRLLELVDLKSKDTSFIKNKDDRELIDKVLKLDIFNDLDNASIYQEYGYYDEELLSSGFIDLLIIKDDEYYIIDYKNRNIYDNAYDSQLRTYMRNIKTLFNINDSSKIHLYLLSIELGKLRKVEH